MANTHRMAMTRLIYRRLADPSFRRCLTATAPDGTRPVVVALRDDPMSGLVDKVHWAGGSANVVVPALNGFMVIEMEVERTALTWSRDPESQELANDCTVGLFVARLRVDDGVTPYQLTVRDDGPWAGQGNEAQRSRSGRAKVVALGS